MKKNIKYMKYLFYFSYSSLKLFFVKNIFRRNIKYEFKSIIHKNVSIRTKEKGKIELGNMITIRPNAEISATGGKIELNDNIYINRNTMIVAHDYISIGKGTTIGPNVLIYDHDHTIGKNKKNGTASYITAPIFIRKKRMDRCRSNYIKGSKYWG